MSSSAKPPPKIDAPEILRGIWGKITPSRMLDAILQARPGEPWTLSGFRILGPCPFHDDSTPSFNIYLDRGYSKCYGCDRYDWNPLKVWAACVKMSLSDAFEQIRVLFPLSLPKNATKHIQDSLRHQLMKRMLSQVFHEELIIAASMFPSGYTPGMEYAHTTVQYLVHERNLDLKSLPALDHLGILPPLARVRSQLEGRLCPPDMTESDFATLITGAIMYLDNVKLLAGSITFRLDTAPDSIGRFKVRPPYADSSHCRFISDDVDTDLGFFGLGALAYKPLIGKEDAALNRVYVVEGEFDALAFHSNQLLSGAGYVVVSTSGEGCKELDQLTVHGFQEAYLLPDAPTKNGDVLARSWLEQCAKLRTRIFSRYDLLPKGNDPDSAIVQHGFAAVNAVLLTPSSFVLPHLWIFEQAQTAVSALAADDLRARIEALATWGRSLRNPHECDAYIETCSKTYQVSPGLLRKEILALVEDEPGFILRLTCELQKQFAVIGQESSRNGRKLHLWHNDSREMLVVAPSDNSLVERELGFVLGPGYEFVENRLGMPSFLEPPPIKKNNSAYLKSLTDQLNFHFRQALLNLMKNAPDYRRLTPRSQGMHYLFDGTDNTTAYLVNGKRVYRADYAGVSDPVWRELNAPLDNNNVFLIDSRVALNGWLPAQVNSLEALNAASKDIALMSVYDRLVDILNTGFTFKNHDVTVEFLAAYLMAMPIAGIFERKPTVFVNAESQSGKSTLTHGLIGGAQFQSIHVLACAHGVSNFTSAWMRQWTNHMTRPLCLDEFEPDTKTKRGNTVNDIMELIRSTGADRSANLGAADGEGQSQSFDYPLFVSAINRPEKSQDLNRMIMIEMMKTEGHNDSQVSILTRLGAPFVAKLKQDLAIGMYPHAMRIRNTHREMRMHYGMTANRPKAVTNRTMDALLLAMSVMRYLGRNDKSFLQAYSECNADFLDAVGTGGEADQLFHAIMHVPCIEIRGDQTLNRSFMSVGSLISDVSTRELIGVSGVGVYYDSETRTLAVLWPTAQLAFFRNNPRFRSETNPYNLTEMANRSPRAWKGTQAQLAFDRLKRRGIVGHTPRNTTVYYVGDLIDEANTIPLRPGNQSASTEAQEPHVKRVQSVP